MAWWWLAFAVFLYLACAALLAAEIFVPSGGLLTLCAMACAAGGVYIFFQQSTTVGVLGLVSAGIMVPVVLLCAYKIFPHTRFGRAVTLEAPTRRVGDGIPDGEQMQDLIGRRGVTRSPLRPVGSCDFSGRRVECMAESGYVDRGKTVEVISVQGSQVTVRQIKES